MADGPTPEHDELVYESAGLPKTINWWGAFVIGLAGTILVTGIAPYAVQGMGASAIWAIGINTVFGLVLCLRCARRSMSDLISTKAR